MVAKKTSAKKKAVKNPAPVTQEANAPAPDTYTHLWVRSLPPRFRRAGRVFTQERVRIAVADLTKTALAAILREPQLAVTPTNDEPDA